MRILFDSKQSQFKTPFGTLVPDQSCTLNIHIPSSVQATRVFFDIVPDGGVIDLSYNISIENSEAGVIDYHLDIRAK